MSNTAKKVLSLVLAIVMIVSLIPIIALASSSFAFEFDTSGITEAVNPGETITIPLNVTANAGWTALNIDITYDDVFENVSISEEGSAFSADGFDNDGLSLFWECDENDTTTGLFVTISLTVKSDAAAGAANVYATVRDITDEDYESYQPSITPATITIAGAEEGFSFTNGTDSYEFTTLQADNYTLTSPGENYYFAGWFTGLEAADAASEALSLTDGYYVLADNSVTDSDTFAITELRPKYADVAPETGAYHALWIYDDESGENPVTAIVLQVSDNSVTYRKADNAEGEYTDINATVLANAIDGSARIKLIKDMELESDVFSCANGIKLDMNGCTILETNIQPNAHLFDLAGGIGVFESSRGKGTITVETVDGTGYSAAINTTADTTLYLRDLNITSVGYGYRSNGGTATFEYIRNCTINTNRNSLESNYTSSGTLIKELSNCHITSATHVIGENYSNKTELLNISDTTLIATGGDEVFDCAIVTFKGDGNVVNNTATGNLFGWCDVTFESAGGTYVASGGTAIGSSVTTTAPEGCIIRDNSGTLILVSGFTVDYYNNSGSSWLADSTFATGETAVCEWERNDVREGLEFSEFIGWSLQQNVNITDMDEASSVLVDWRSITEDTNVYAAYYVYNLEPTVSATYTVGGVAAEETNYYNIDDAYEAATDAGAESLTVILITDTVMEDTISYTDMDITIDLMGHTLSATTGGGDESSGTYLIANDSNGGWLGWGATGGSGELTICSTGSRGSIALHGYQLVTVVAGTSDVGAVTISNVDITRTGLDYGYYSGVFGFYNYNKSATNGNLILDDVTVNTTSYVFATYVNSNTATSGYRITATDCTFESTYDSILGYMSKDDGKNAPQNFSITFDSATKFKSNNADAPVLSTFASYVSGPEGTELTAGDDGWYTFAIPHTCDYAELKYDETNHWYECECGATNGVTAHTYENGECTGCDAVDPNYVPPINTADIFTNNSGTTTPATITAPTDGWKYGVENTFTVACAKACVVLAKDADGNYKRLTATLNKGTAYNFTVSLEEGMTLVVAIKGDVNGDGKVTAADAAAASAIDVGNITADALMLLVMDVNKDGKVTAADSAAAKAVDVGNLTMPW